MSDLRRAPAALEVRGLDVYYGHSHALQGVDLTLDSGVFSVVGRNGMGKTTLCKTIMGLLAPSGGSVRVRGQDITRQSPAAIARLGVGYVPQGRRLWRSLTVDEHLRLTSGIRQGPWTIERIYDTFPRLAERKTNGGGQLSGGEQQMLAIGRALLTNPHLLIMDEPTEGLAPVIVAQVEEMLVRLGEEGEISVLVIEQNIGVATAISKSVAIMVNGRINRIIDSVRLAADRDLQQRLLGVGVHAEADIEIDAPAAETAAAPPRPRGSAPIRIYISNPVPPTRWSQPVPIARIEASARMVSTGVTRLEAPSTRQVEARRSQQPSGPPVVLVAGTLDTKGAELRFIRDIIAASGLRTRLVDVSTSGKAQTCDVSAQEIALNHVRGGAAVFGSDRGTSVTAMAEAFANWIRRQDNLAGIISAGGSGGASLVAPAMRSLSVGVPKLIISSVASGDVGPYVGPADITMMYSVTDVQGLNSISRAVLANGANALVGMVKARLGRARRRSAPDIVKSAGDRHHHVRCDDAGRAEDHGRSARRIRMSGLSCHRHWRTVDGEAGRFEPARRRDRSDYDRSLRPPDGRRVSRHRRSLRRHHPQPHSVHRLGRRARHGQFRQAGDDSGALSPAQIPHPQPAGDLDAHDRRGERAHGTLDRRAAEPHGWAGALLPARGRRVGAGCAGTAVLGPRGRRSAVSRARTDRARDRQPSAHSHQAQRQRAGIYIRDREHVAQPGWPRRGAPESGEVSDGPV
ncbi:fragment of conserved hypothetical protein (part 1) [Bradyrhizobium sp. STM 3843]|nr:fragment of conserved hypothetical protein (part 1) [Bradyrhizobium sp. STM 3843]